MLRCLLASSLVLTVSVTAAGCLVAPSNRFDPDAPAELQAPARVDVTVKDTDSNVVVDGVTVRVEGAADNVDGVRDGDVFVVDGIAPGAVTVVVDSAAAGTATRDIELVAGETRALTVVVAADAAQLGTISGTARKESQVVEAAPDHSGVVVEAFVAGVSTGVRVITNAAGRYDMAIAAGTYSLSFSAAEHEPQDRADVAVAAGAVTDVDVVTLEVNPGSIDGVVALEDLVDDDDAVPSPAGVTVALVGGAVTTTADAAGEFRLTGLPPGAQSLRFSFADHQSVEVPVVVRAGTTADIAPVTLLHNRGVVFGVVSVAGAADNSGVLVEADGSGVIDVTGVDGSFSLRVPTGTWDIIATKSGTRRARNDGVVVADGARVDAGAFSLEPNVGALVINDDSGLTNNPVVQLRLDEEGAVSVRVSEDVGFGDDPADVAYPPDGVVDFTLSAGDGDKDVFVQVVDSGGDIKSLSGSIFLDTTAPTLDDVVVNSDPDLAITRDVSIIVSVIGAGADEMAIATDGEVDSELFTPFAAAAVAVLPSVDGDHDVCAVVRDRAGNEAGPLCTTLALETVVPVSPRFLLNGRLAEGTVLTTANAEVFRLQVVPFGGAQNDDVEALEGTVEADDVEVGGRGVDVAFACAPDGNGLIVCDDGDAVPGLLLPLFLETQAGREVRPNLITMRARDRAGNLSADSTFLVVVDDRAPLPPTPTNAACVAPDAAGGCPDNVYAGPLNRNGAPVNVNSDSFTVQLNEVPGDLDATFARYLVATTVGDDLGQSLTAADFAATASVDNLVFSLTQGAPLNGAPNSQTCNPLRCVNHLFIVGVDVAGNLGPRVRVDVVEDSSPPTRPTLSPRGGLQRGAVTELRLAAPSIDRAGVAGGDEAVFAYEIKEGTDGAFEGVPDGQLVQGPWSLGVLPDDVSEVCVRGIDEAGNVGIEDCVVVEEATRRFPVRTELSDRRVVLGGDRLAVVIESELLIHGFDDDDITDGAGALADSIGSINNTGILRGAHRYDPVAGVDVFDVISDFSFENGGGTPRFLFFANAQPGMRSVCGRGASTDGVNVVFERGGRLVQATRTQIINNVAPSLNEPPGCTNVGTDLGPITNFCATTAVMVAGDNIVWCEGNGVIRRRSAGVTTTLTSTGARDDLGLFGRNEGFQQPLVTSTATFFAEGAPATIRRQPHGGAAVDTGVRTASLGAVDGERVAYFVLDDGGAAIDTAVVDLAVSTTPRRLTNDLAPQSQITIDGGRVAWVDLSSFSEDIAVVDLTTQRWIAAGPTVETQPAVGDGLAVWAIFDTTLQVLARVDLPTGGNREVTLVAVPLGELENAPFTFVGGTPLGPPTIGAGGKTAFLFRNDGATWSLRAVAADGPTPPVQVLLSDLRPTQAGEEASTTTWGLSADGTRLVTISSADQLRLSRLAGASVVDNDSLVSVAANVVVPHVDVEAVGAGAVTVAQIGNNVAPFAGNGGGAFRSAFDDRTGFVGDLTCFATNATGGVVSSGVVRRGGQPLVGRAPSVAAVGNKLFMTYQEVANTGAVRNHVCELSCGATPTCTADVLLGANDDGPPALSRTGLAVWLTATRSAFGDVSVFDVVKNRPLLLTGAGGDTSPRSFVDVNGDRVTWSDARLGNFDLWESVVAH